MGVCVYFMLFSWHVLPLSSCGLLQWHMISLSLAGKKRWWGNNASHSLPPHYSVFKAMESCAPAGESGANCRKPEARVCFTARHLKCRIVRNVCILKCFILCLKDSVSGRGKIYIRTLNCFLCRQLNNEASMRHLNNCNRCLLPSAVYCILLFPLHTGEKNTWQTIP